MSDRGVSGFWLDIKSLEIARTTLIAELGAKEDLLACLGVYCLLATQEGWPETPEEAAWKTQTDPRVLRRFWPHLTAARSASV